MCSRWRPDQLHGCCLYTSVARRIKDLDFTSFYPGKLTTVIRVCVASVSAEI